MQRMLPCISDHGRINARVEPTDNNTCQKTDDPARNLCRDLDSLYTHEHPLNSVLGKMTNDPEHSPPAQAADTAEEQVAPLVRGTTERSSQTVDGG